MTHSVDTSGLIDIKKRLEKVVDIISRKNGTIVNLTQEKIFTKGGPFLHQDTKETTEEDSAQFERDNPEIFAYLLALNEQLEGLF